MQSGVSSLFERKRVLMAKRTTNTIMIEVNIDGEIVCLPASEMRKYFKERNLPTDILKGKY
jgi:tRNA(His) 5'-end guanylyltransferase